MEFLSSIYNAPGGTGVVFIIIVVMALAFLLRFVFPALLLWLDLRRASRALTRLLPSSPSLDQIADEVMQSPRLAHAWREYAHTLHRQKTPQGDRIRATSAAGHFFSIALLVEAPLKAGFYRHLPGILTGLGIIGTFAGLISGLSDFEVNSDTEVVRFSLRNLIQGVGHAFQVSAAAISLAMLTIWLEKSLLSMCSRHVIRLAEGLDSLFEGGVEEEYLARLVLASEYSARQMGDLKKALTETNQTELAEKIAAAVAQSLRDPLVKMAKIVEKSGTSQGEATAQSLKPLLTSFMEKMEGQWDKSGAGLEKLLAQSAEAMKKAAAEMTRVIGRVDTIGQGAVSTAAAGLSNAGAKVGQAAADFSGVSETLRAVSASLAEAATQASEVMRDSAESRDAFKAILSDLRGVLENARREASLTTELVERMESAAGVLLSARNEAVHYLEGVNKVLTEAHSSFAENIERTLREGNSQFHKEVALAVDYLKGAIEELGDTLENLAGKK
ncbi:MAG: hypothetical protein LBI31_05765 [Zoogloeaceae bacterium]|jgi:ABC-type transporter Mla subunit MlaD|nr:hypothetical protein [Zoogloeaceae bacterium]